MPLVSWNSLPIETVESKLKTSIQGGLSRDEARVRLEQFGRNELPPPRGDGYGDRVLSQLKNPLVLVLLAAGIVTLGIGIYVDALVIFLALSINIVIGIIQEGRASKAFAKLAASESPTATVIRGGEPVVVPVAQVVPGDVVVLMAGSRCAADMRLTEAHELSINESALTGEWVPIEKTADVTKPHAPIGDRINMAWKGTLVEAGSGKGIVVATGSETELGRIAEGLGRGGAIRTPIQRNIRTLAVFLTRIVLVVVGAIFVIGVMRGEALADMALLAIAVAVSVIPEGLPAAVTVVLAIGMEKILSRGGLVRNLLSAETLGATTVVLTDKTGTLTEARMHLDEIVTLGTKESDRMHALRAAVLASDAFVEYHGNSVEEYIIRGKPMERAVIRAGLDAGIAQHEIKKHMPQIDFIPFDSERRFAAALYEEGAGTELFLSGAPEALLEHAGTVLKNGRAIACTKEHRDFFNHAIRMHGQNGVRMMAVAERRTGSRSLGELWNKKEGLLHAHTFVGILCFTDPLRKDVPEAIARVRGAGASVYMVTGDNPETAHAVARDAGITEDTSRPVIGNDLEELTDDDVVRLFRTRSVFARVLPSQKLRLVRLLRERGEVVAMTGDGINDAPALRNADIGVAVGSGTDVAKEAADLVLINDSFSIIVGAIEEGRRIIDNLKKVVVYLLSTSFHEVAVIFVSLIAGSSLPILPVQILWMNIIEEGLLSLGFAFEPGERDLMKRNPRAMRAKSILTSELRKLILTVGIITSIVGIVVYLLLVYATDYSDASIRTIMFIVFSLDSILFALSLKNLHGPFWKVDFLGNRYLLFAIGMSIMLLIVTLTLSPLRALLSLEPLTPSAFLILSGVGIANLLTIELSKKFVFRAKNG